MTTNGDDNVIGFPRHVRSTPKDDDPSGDGTQGVAEIDGCAVSEVDANVRDIEHAFDEQGDTDGEADGQNERLTLLHGGGLSHAKPNRTGVTVSALSPTFSSPALPGTRFTGLGRHDAPLKRFRHERTTPPLWSASATWRDLVQERDVPAMSDLPARWGTDWTVTYRHGKNTLTASVASVGIGDLLIADPIRVNSWHPNKTARAGLRFVHSTGYHHAHESLFERKLLYVLDFDDATAIASQPFTLTWHDGHRYRHHTPDFLVEVDGHIVIINTRPAALVKDQLVEDATAVGEVCLSRGWDHSLVVGYSLPGITTVETVETHANSTDHLGYTDEVLDLLTTYGPTAFADVCDAFEAPLLARATLQRLVWERQVSVDLNAPLQDWSLVALPGEETQP